MPLPTMLAEAITLDQINDDLFSAGPLIVQPKYDGIRVQVHHGVAYSGREGKQLPNEYIQSWCQSYLAREHLDGEMIVVRDNGTTLPFANCLETGDRGIESLLMSRLGAPNFQYVLFDDLNHPQLRYVNRLELANMQVDVLRQFGQNNRVLKIVSWDDARPASVVHSLDACLASGHEGICLRLASGPYKPGRSTFNERYLLKYKAFLDDEAFVLDMEELVREDGTRGNTLGALVVRSLKFDETFKIGTGFTSAMRDWIWHNIGKVGHQQLTYKYLPHGTKIRPRSPVFLRFRHSDT